MNMYMPCLNSCQIYMLIVANITACSKDNTVQKKIMKMLKFMSLSTKKLTDGQNNDSFCATTDSVSTALCIIAFRSVIDAYALHCDGCDR